MSNELKTQIISAVKTFLSAFLITVAIIFIETDTIVLNSVFWVSLGIAGFRAGLSALIAPYIPVKLGGKKV